MGRGGTHKTKGRLSGVKDRLQGIGKRKQHRSTKKGKGKKQREPMVEESSRSEETRVEAGYKRKDSRLEAKAKQLEQMGEEYKVKVLELEADFKGESESEQRIFIANTYNMFAPKYTLYMDSTGHHRAMKDIVLVLGHHLRLPLIDVSAGPGVMVEYIFNKFILSSLTRQISKNLRADKDPNAFSLLALKALVDEMEGRPTTELPVNSDRSPLIVVNDFSQGMIQIAKKRFTDLAENICAPLKGKPKKKLREEINEFFHSNIVFTQHAIEDLPDIFGDNCFASVFCSQTMHVTHHKEAVLGAISRILRPGGTFLSIEEFPFRISSTTGYEDIMSRLHATVDPIEDKITFQKMVERTNEYRKKDRKKTNRKLFYVDGSEIRTWVKGTRHRGDKHPIYGFLFEKEGTLYMPKPPKFWEP